MAAYRNQRLEHSPPPAFPNALPLHVYKSPSFKFSNVSKQIKLKPVIFQMVLNSVAPAFALAGANIYDQLKPTDLKTPTKFAQWIANDPVLAAEDLWYSAKTRVKWKEIGKQAGWAALRGACERAVYIGTRAVLSGEFNGAEPEKVLATLIHNKLKDFQNYTLITNYYQRTGIWESNIDTIILNSRTDIADDLPDMTLRPDLKYFEPWLSSYAMAVAEETFAKNLLFQLSSFGVGLVIETYRLVQGKTKLTTYLQKVIDNIFAVFGRCIGAGFALGFIGGRIDKDYYGPTTTKFILFVLEYMGLAVGGDIGRWLSKYLITGKLSDKKQQSILKTIEIPTPEKAMAYITDSNGLYNTNGNLITSGNVGGAPPNLSTVHYRDIKKKMEKEQELEDGDEESEDENGVQENGEDEDDDTKEQSDEEEEEEEEEDKKKPVKVNPTKKNQKKKIPKSAMEQRNNRFGLYASGSDEDEDGEDGEEDADESSEEEEELPRKSNKQQNGKLNGTKRKYTFEADDDSD